MGHINMFRLLVTRAGGFVLIFVKFYKRWGYLFELTGPIIVIKLKKNLRTNFLVFLNWIKAFHEGGVVHGQLQTGTNPAVDVAPLADVSSTDGVAVCTCLWICVFRCHSFIGFIKLIRFAIWIETSGNLNRRVNGRCASFVCLQINF